MDNYIEELNKKFSQLNTIKDKITTQQISVAELDKVLSEISGVVGDLQSITKENGSEGESSD
jgi:ABC-type transporter Mla subunit MlaD